MANKLYTYNDSFFDTISLEAAYWAGFIAADGCISERDSALILVGKYEDKDHMQEFADAIDFTGPIKINRGGGYKPNIYARLAIYGCHGMIRALAKHYNVVPNKTKVLMPPPYINNVDFQVAFFAGFVDGDGSIFVTEKGPCISLGGTKSMMVWCKDLVDHLSPYQKEAHVRQTNHVWFHEYKVRSLRATAIGRYVKSLGLPLMARKWCHV